MVSFLDASWNVWNASEQRIRSPATRWKAAPGGEQLLSQKPLRDWCKGVGWKCGLIYATLLVTTIMVMMMKDCTAEGKGTGWEWSRKTAAEHPLCYGMRLSRCECVSVPACGELWGTENADDFWCWDYQDDACFLMVNPLCAAWPGEGWWPNSPWSRV